MYTWTHLFFIITQVEATDDYNAERAAGIHSSNGETLDMQKGDKANVLRKLTESGKRQHSISELDNVVLQNDNNNQWDDFL